MNARRTIADPVRVACFAALLSALPIGVRAGDLTGPIYDQGLTAVLEDVLQLPVSIPGGSGQPRARVNVLRSVPGGGGKLWVCDLNGPLYVVQGTTVSMYLDFRTLPNFRRAPGLATGLVSFAFHPAFADSGLFYTVHTENVASKPPNIVPAIDTVGSQHSILTEWRATNPSANTFSGTSRELMRVESIGHFHNAGILEFNPNATTPSHPDYGYLYIPAGDYNSVDAGSPNQLQRLDTIYGCVLRIDPRGGPFVRNSITYHYGIPPSNPFANTPGAFGEIYTYGHRNAHRVQWEIGHGETMFATDIGGNNIEEVDLLVPGRNYGWPFREGTVRIDPYVQWRDALPLPPNDSTFGYTYPVAQFDHDPVRFPFGGQGTQQCGISGGYACRAAAIPGLRDKFVFGDIVTGQMFYSYTDSLVAADDGDRTTMARIFELRLQYQGEYRTLLDIVRAKTGNPALNRTDLRFAMDAEGTLYVTTKDDGMIRKITSVFVRPGYDVPEWSASGGQAGALFGNAVASAGDVNGDGYDDVIVGAPEFFNGGQTGEGRAYLFHGSAAGLNADTAWTAQLDRLGANFGHAVAGAGDVNGDGYDDVVVGAPKYDDTGQSDEGRIYVYLGSSAGLARSPVWVGESNQSGAQLGRSVAGAGDVDGDGYDDVIAGAYHYENGADQEGRAFLYRGSSNGQLIPDDWRAEGNQPFAYFGYSVASAGDVNADGYDDVIVGALNHDGNQPDDGRAYLYHGSASGPDSIPSWTADGDQDSALFGISVAGAGDVNGDGYSDVIVGADHHADPEPLEGGAFVYFGSASGLSPSPAWTIHSDQAYSILGLSVAGAGDFDHDGHADVVLGAPKLDRSEIDEGGAFLYRGLSNGLTSYPAWTGGSGQDTAFFGFSVAGAGDVNGDGASDVIVGAKFFDGTFTDEGRAYVYYGSADAVSVPHAATSRGLQLVSIHPNPLATRATIRYSLPRAGAASVSIHDVQGRRVARWDERAQPAGVHQIEWSPSRRGGDRLGAGIYWVRLESSGETVAKKLVLR